MCTFKFIYIYFRSVFSSAKHALLYITNHFSLRFVHVHGPDNLQMSLDAVYIMNNKDSNQTPFIGFSIRYIYFVFLKIFT